MNSNNFNAEFIEKKTETIDLKLFVLFVLLAKSKRSEV